MLWLLLVLGCASVLVLVGWSQLSIRSVQPAAYVVASTAEVEPFVRSWGQWLQTHGRIGVRHPSSGAEAEFRKRRYKTRPDVLVFRYRNADGNRKYFEQVRSRFEAEGIEYQLEHTRKQQRARAITVVLNSSDVFAPVVAVRLLSVALGSAGPELLVFCEGRMRTGTDAPPIALIPWNRARQAGFRIGRLTGRLWSRLTAP